MNGLLEPNATLYPLPVVLVTCGRERPNVFALNRISSCNAEPPTPTLALSKRDKRGASVLAISVRPMRYSPGLIDEQGEFVVNIPTPGMELISD